MLVLGIDVSTRACSVAVVNRERTVAEAFLLNPGTHSQKLMVLLDQILRQGEVDFQEITGLAVTVGPGSFTGLRIGLATARGLAHGWGKPLVGISTLEALAHNLQGVEGVICPVLNARKGEVYTALYQGQGRGIEPLAPPRAVAPQALARQLEETSGNLWILGDGADVLYPFLTPASVDRLRPVASHYMYPQAVQVAQLARQPLLDGRVGNFNGVRPIYLRPSEAEVKRKKPAGD